MNSSSPAAPAKPRYPSLYQINTRVWLTELSARLGRPRHAGRHSGRRTGPPGRDGVRLDLVPERLADRAGAAQQVSRSNPEWRREFQETLPDLRDEDIAGSGFAITGYTVHADLGGDAALARLRERLRERGLRLMLDFVPNHTGLDHPWVEDHPEYYIAGTASWTWRGRRRTTPGSSASGAICCWPMAATRISPAGPTRCSSTTATRPRRRR